MRLNKSSNIVESMKNVEACQACVESSLNWFKLSFKIDSTFPLFSKMLNGVEAV